MTGTLHIVVAMKPVEGNFSENAVSYGVTGLNINGCRIATAEIVANHSRGDESAVSKGKYGSSKGQKTHQTEGQMLGRFPANVIHDGSEGVVKTFPDVGKAGCHGNGQGGFNSHGQHNCYGKGSEIFNASGGYSGSAARFFQACGECQQQGEERD